MYISVPVLGVCFAEAGPFFAETRVLDSVVARRGWVLPCFGVLGVVFAPCFGNSGFCFRVLVAVFGARRGSMHVCKAVSCFPM